MFKASIVMTRWVSRPALMPSCIPAARQFAKTPNQHTMRTQRLQKKSWHTCACTSHDHRLNDNSTYGGLYQLERVGCAASCGRGHAARCTSVAPWLAQELIKSTVHFSRFVAEVVIALHLPQMMMTKSNIVDSQRTPGICFALCYQSQLYVAGMPRSLRLY